MRYIFVLVLLSFSLFANSIVDIYRDSGIKAVEAYIQKQLESKKYWDEKLQNLDLQFGYYEKLDSLLIANKKAKELTIYSNRDNKLELLAKYGGVIVGADGDKAKEGDLKTPLGVYTLRRRFAPDDPFYGPLAFVMSYPNTYDKVQGKDGHGIWIHGSPIDGSARDPMSKGCIVLDNDTLILLDEKLQNKSSNSIVIVSENGMKDVEKSEIAILLSELFRWQRTWRDNDIEEYLDFYDKDFKRYDGMSRKDFSKRKRNLFSRNQKKEIVFSNINISPYPDESGKRLFKIAFHQKFTTKTYKFRGNKELFVELIGDSFKIITER